MKMLTQILPSASSWTFSSIRTKTVPLEEVMMQESVTAAILLGASIFPQHSYSPSPAFLRSKQDFRRYLQDSDAGLALRDDAILDLFDSDHLAGKQLVTVGWFLDKFNDQADRESLRNLIVYYVGHGFF